jgi:cytochrome b subunit of formate dehydrogenase
VLFLQKAQTEQTIECTECSGRLFLSRYIFVTTKPISIAFGISTCCPMNLIIVRIGHLYAIFWTVFNYQRIGYEVSNVKWLWTLNYKGCI